MSDLTPNQARAGVTGHNVRYILAYGVVGVIIAFAAIGMYFRLGVQPRTAPAEIHSTPIAPQPSAPADGRTTE